MLLFCCLFSSLFGVMASGCAQQARDGWAAPRKMTPGFSGSDRAAAARDAAPAAAPAPATVRLASFKETDNTTAGGKRVVIYNAGYRIVVQEIDAAIKQTEKVAEDLGGYVNTVRTDQIVIRVPVTNYKKATELVEALGIVSHRELEALDVTEEYVDLEARLKSAMAVRTRLEGLLAKAEDVKAALEVEKELSRVGEEIERLQAKLELLKNRVAYSTITVDFERVSRATPSPQVFKLPFDWLHELDPNRLTQTY